ncbi:hypothetical protein Nepgr_032502 [Nepenthes gracilis]|uniref:Uncharacterized protein n=1 Tax=Nepenthes gracilis TaxID=150966 RepID=A0AAD3Y7Y0_NEPGR|nr:hypothetical protein Nepgr_032502 [Nepenthes gracilis]
MSLETMISSITNSPQRPSAVCFLFVHQKKEQRRLYEAMTIFMLDFLVPYECRNKGDGGVLAGQLLRACENRYLYYGGDDVNLSWKVSRKSGQMNIKKMQKMLKNAFKPFPASDLYSRNQKGEGKRKFCNNQNVEAVMTCDMIHESGLQAEGNCGL